MEWSVKMNDYDFRKMDRELEQKLSDPDNIFDWNPRTTNEESPPEFILIPIGEYNGVDLPDIIIGIPCEFFNDPDTLEIAYSDYIVWLEVPNPEYGELIWY
jgi:hypothetical protein